MKRKESPAVPMPEKKIIRKKAPNGTVYIYYTLRSYRNKKGQPTSETVLIGKLAGNGVSLVPNQNYYEVFPDERPPMKMPQIMTVLQAGTTGVFEILAKRLGLWSALELAFPEDFRAIMTVAMYMAEQGNVMAYIDEWQDVTATPCQSLSSQYASRLFGSITHADRQRFFREWTKKHREQEHIAYDVTSISTHSDSIDQAEWGHNRDGESLCQVNIGMFYGVTGGLPLYYSLYNGSISDKSHLDYMMAGALGFGIKNVEFILDKGFVTAHNLKSMSEAGFKFLAPCPPSRKDARELVDVIGSAVKDPANWLAEEECYGMKSDFCLLGQDLFAHIFFDSSRFAEKEKGLYAYIDRLEAELSRAKKGKIQKKYRDFFSFADDAEKKEELKFSRDEGAISKALERVGFVVFITNDQNLSPYEVLRLYRRRDDIEKAFDDLKNAIDFKRLKTQSQKTTDGKAFCGFIALILRSHMHNLLQQDEATRDITMKKALLELAKLRYVVTDEGEELFLPPTKTQVTIAKALGVALV